MNCLLQGNQQFIWDSGKFDKKSLLLSPSEFQFKMDAAFHVMNGTKGITYDIRGKGLCFERHYIIETSQQEISWSQTEILLLSIL